MCLKEIAVNTYWLIVIDVREDLLALPKETATY